MEPDSQSATASPVPRRDDLLADARCLKCGYPLRGLPENRCPECGTAFDPADFAGTFLPQWPRLMAWYLAACVVMEIEGLLPALFRWNLKLLLIFRVAANPLHQPVNIMRLCDAALICLLGPVCIVGLCRRRDWARKGCIVIFITTALYILSCLQVLSGVPSRLLGTSEVIYFVIFGLELVCLAAQTALVAVFLATGLRRKSLSRAGEAAPELSRTLSDPRRDWLLLFALLLCGLGILPTFNGVELLALSLVPKLLSAAAPDSQLFSLTDVRGVLNALTGSFILAAAFLLWRRPGMLRMLISVVALAMVGHSVFRIASDIGTPLTPGGSPRDALTIVLEALSAAVSFLPYLAPLLFAFLAVKREDIDRLAREDGRGA
ncbi:MAG: hypothetical protein JXL80_15710 [Planctomycetes bacterium]|nr:hypothetical protein [Planctomycetota bacterium]